MPRALAAARSAVKTLRAPVEIFARPPVGESPLIDPTSDFLIVTGRNRGQDEQQRADGDIPQHHLSGVQPKKWTASPPTSRPASSPSTQASRG